MHIVLPNTPTSEQTEASKKTSNDFFRLTSRYFGWTCCIFAWLPKTAIFISFSCDVLPLRTTPIRKYWWNRWIFSTKLSAHESPDKTQTPEWMWPVVYRKPATITKRQPLTIAHFEDFFKLFPKRGVSERSWCVPIEEIEAKNYDLKAVNLTHVRRFQTVYPKKTLTSHS